MNKIKVILAGGFLGAGKTTSVIQLAKLLDKKGLKTAIILNDQGSNLVDSELVKSNGFGIAEITGGCFCCKFHDLMQSIDGIIHEICPDVLIAEPVGSCTDLVSTVFLPIQKYYPGKFSLAPYTAVLDATLISKLLNEGTFPFSPEIQYLYEKQLQEANILLMNKVDLLEPTEVKYLQEALKERFPGRLIIPVCASYGNGFEQWLRELMVEFIQDKTLCSIDYETYGRAESMLGWFNNSFQVQSNKVFDPNDFILELMTIIQENINNLQGKIAHLKCIGKCSGGLIKASSTQSSSLPVFSAKGYDFTKELDIIINARVEIEAGILKQEINQAIDILTDKYFMSVKLEHQECFKPSFPTPVHPREDYN